MSDVRGKLQSFGGAGVQGTVFFLSGVASGYTTTRDKPIQVVGVVVMYVYRRRCHTTEARRSAI